MLQTEKLCFNCFIERNTDDGVCPLCGYHEEDSREKYPTALMSGSILNGQYIIGRVLGQGGFGITYLALDYNLNIKVAIKEFLPDGMATRLPETTHVSVYAGEQKENFLYGTDRFLDEARVLAKFAGNKNIAAVKSYFNENNTAYFVMDYIEGISFKNYIKNKGGKVDYNDAIRILMPVMNALSAVHKEGFIHRDVTPDNIYITKDDEIKLLDFGSARYSFGDKSKSLDVILKAGYAPKEQYTRRNKQGAYTDVYSLAACFYSSITGFLPPESLERMDEDDILSISACGIKIPDALEEAIMKGLEVRAENRFQSMEEFKSAIITEDNKINAQPNLNHIAPSDLEQLVTPEPTALEPALPEGRKNKMLLFLPAAACLVLVISIVGMIGSYKSSQSIPSSSISGSGAGHTVVNDIQQSSLSQVEPSVNLPLESSLPENDIVKDNTPEVEEEEESQNQPLNEPADPADADYIISYSDRIELTKEDLKRLTKEELSHARNEIYARHGRMFHDKKLQKYFSEKKWYSATYTPEEFDEIAGDLLNKVELRNAKFIKEYENSKKQKSDT